MFKINPQDLASYVAVIVATVALYVGWDQARIGRNQQHADVYPVVEFKSQYLTKQLENGNTARHLAFSVFNAGVGPAFIETAQWQINGFEVQHVRDLQKAMPEGLTTLDQYQGQFENFILAPGKSEKVWEVLWPNNKASQPLSQMFMETFWAMDLKICYCSLYQRCWISSYQAQTPRPTEVASCGSAF
ncbi:MAG: hypothetical protein ACFHVJ_06345 [Aestuariibacter sp.]